MTTIWKAYLAWFTGVLFCLLAVAPSYAATDQKFSWTPNTANTQGYRLLMDSGTNVVAEIPGINASEYTFSVVEDAVCHSFALIAYAGDITSDPSDFAVWCPPNPAQPQKFILTLEPMAP